LYINEKRRLGVYGNGLAKRSHLFSNQLFDGCDSLYTCYCLHQYIRTDDYANRKFRFAVLMLFFQVKTKAFNEPPFRERLVDFIL